MPWVCLAQSDRDSSLCVEGRGFEYFRNNSFLYCYVYNPFIFILNKLSNEEKIDDIVVYFEY